MKSKNYNPLIALRSTYTYSYLIVGNFKLFKHLFHRSTGRDFQKTRRIANGKNCKWRLSSRLWFQCWIVGIETNTWRVCQFLLWTIDSKSWYVAVFAILFFFFYIFILRFFLIGKYLMKNQGQRDVNKTKSTKRLKNE